MICTPLGLESLRRVSDHAVAEFEHKVDTTVIGGLSKAVYLERLRRYALIERHSKPANLTRRQYARNQVRRTGRALGKPTCCGEPRQLYAKHMLEALETILHRRGLK